LIDFFPISIPIDFRFFVICQDLSLIVVHSSSNNVIILLLKLASGKNAKICHFLKNGIFLHFLGPFFVYLSVTKEGMPLKGESP